MITRVITRESGGESGVARERRGVIHRAYSQRARAVRAVASGGRVWWHDEDDVGGGCASGGIFAICFVVSEHDDGW